MDFNALIFPVAVVCGAIVVKARVGPGSIELNQENGLILAVAALFGLVIFWLISRKVKPLVNFIHTSEENQEVSNDLDDYEYLERISKLFIVFSWLGN